MVPKVFEPLKFYCIISAFGLYFFDGCGKLAIPPMLNQYQINRIATIRKKYLENWPGKFRKDLESQGKVKEFENKWLWQADSEN